MSTILPSVQEVASTLDYHILNPNLTRKELTDELVKADELKVYSVFVRPSDVAFAKEFLSELKSDVVIGTVVGFPHGSNTTAVKAVEALEAIDNGATEIDIVVNISWVLDENYVDVVREIFEITTVAREAGVNIVKVVFENAYLNVDQIENLTNALQDSGADFVSTSTGFASSGATINDVAIMHYNRGHMKVKAFGDIYITDNYLKFFEVGVTRFGTSDPELILTELTYRLEDEGQVTNEDERKN